MSTLNYQEDSEDQIISYGITSFSGDFDTGLDESDSNFEDDELEVARFAVIFALLLLLCFLSPFSNRHCVATLFSTVDPATP